MPKKLRLFHFRCLIIFFFMGECNVHMVLQHLLHLYHYNKFRIQVHVHVVQVFFFETFFTTSDMRHFIRSSRLGFCMKNENNMHTP